MTEWLTKWSQIVANLTIVIALFFTAAAFYGEYTKAKSAQSREFVREFNGEELARARSTLFRAWSGHDLSEVRGSALPKKAVHAMVERVTDPESRGSIDGEVHLAILNLSAFYDAAQTCISSGRCEPDLILSHAGEYANDFFCLYEREIEKIKTRMVMPRLGSGLVEISTAMGGCFNEASQSQAG